MNGSSNFHLYMRGPPCLRNYELTEKRYRLYAGVSIEELGLANHKALAWALLHEVCNFVLPRMYSASINSGERHYLHVLAAVMDSRALGLLSPGRHANFLMSIEDHGISIYCSCQSMRARL